MTVSNTKNRWDYVGNGTAGPFVYDNKILSTSHLQVYVNGVLQTLNTHYTVTGIGSPSGGNVNFISGHYPPNGSRVLLLRVVPLNQLSDYVNHDALNAETLENDLDKIVMMAQQFNEVLSRILKVEVQETVSDVVVQRSANKFLRWNSTAESIDAVTLAEGSINNHRAAHEDGGGDEISIQGLSGLPAAVGQANGIASLDSTGRIPIAQIASGTPDGTKFIRDDRTLATVTTVNRRRFVFPASCFETRFATGWAEFVLVQGTNYDWCEMRFDPNTDERIIAPPVRFSNWNGGSITVRIGWKSAATSGNVMWVVGFLGRSTSTPSAWDASFTDNALSASSTPSTAEFLRETVWTGTPSGIANNDAVIMRIMRDADHTSDTLTVDAKLLYVEVEYTEVT